MKSGWPRWPSRSDSSRSGRSNITSTITPCVPDVLQFLTYMAARTKHAKLGSMVVVLPWHDPIRVAEQVSMLDHLSNGRFILGLGRGLARIEYEGFRLDQNEGRSLFVEYAELVLNALEKGYMEGGRSHQSAPARHSPFPCTFIQGTHLCRRGIARIDADHGEARRRRAGDPAKALGRGQRRISRSTTRSGAKLTAHRAAEAASVADSSSSTRTAAARKNWG